MQALGNPGRTSPTGSAQLLQSMEQPHLAKKLSFGEKAGYGLGDAASNFFFQTSIYFLTFFYTDVFGLSPAAVGTMFLVVRIWDTVNDPIMGIIADRTNTRWGKFRPWMLWGALPFGLIFIATFTTPDLGITGKLVYAYVTYTAMLMVYTVTNVPYSALMGVITPDPQERTQISSFRFAGAFMAGLMVQYLTLILVNLFSGGTAAMVAEAKAYEAEAQTVVQEIQAMPAPSEAQENLAAKHEDWLAVLASWKRGEASRDVSREIFEKTNALNSAFESLALEKGEALRSQLVSAQEQAVAVMKALRDNRSRGYMWAMSIFGALATLFWVMSFATTKERVTPPKDQKSSLKEDLVSLKQNLPWIVISIVSMFMLIFVVVRGGSTLYFFKYTLNAEYALPSYLLVGALITLTGALVAPLFVKRLGKRTALLGIFATSIVAFGGAYFVGPGDWVLLYALNIVASFVNGIQAVVQWAIFADTADYGEWKTGRRNTGLVFSSALFALKTGIAVGGAALGWYLSLVGFEADTVLTETASVGIRSAYTLLPAGLAFICLLVMLAYPLSEANVQEIADELDARRAG